MANKTTDPKLGSKFATVVITVILVAMAWYISEKRCESKCDRVDAVELAD